MAWGQLFIAGLQLLVRSVAQAWQVAAHRAQQEGIRPTVLSSVSRQMTAEEAKQILSVHKAIKSPQDIEKAFKHLYEANDPSKGGSAYLQAKIQNARDKLQEALKNKEKI